MFPVSTRLLLASATLSLFLGCTNSDKPAEAVTTNPANSTGGKQPAAPTTTGDKKPNQPATAEKPGVDWGSLLNSAEQHITKKELEKAQGFLKQLHAAQKDLSAAEKTRLKSLDEMLEHQRTVLAGEQKEAQLDKAKQLFADGDLDETGRVLASLLANAPTEEQQEAARALQEGIEKHRAVRRKLRTGLELLDSNERGRIKEGQQILWDEPEVALPMLLQALKQNKPALVGNALDMLRKMNEPSRSLPAMVGVLGRLEQKECWPAVIKELHRIQQPGAGDPLLKLALETQNPDQAVAAYTALAGVNDPPPQTLVALLPKLFQDGPELEAALGAAYFAVTTHRQYDLAARRGMDGALTPEQDDLLTKLPQRLAAIVAASPADKPMSPLAIAAKRLAVATKQMEPQPLSGVKVVRATAELPEGPVAGVLDGVWNSTDLKTMWRHPPKANTTLMLDLGEERTVTAIKLWNGNEMGAPLRGWKEFEIYVSNSQSPTTPVARGIVPTAPGAPNTPDYGALIPVPFARGRYVKLQLLTVWKEETAAGLSEIQILGY